MEITKDGTCRACLTDTPDSVSVFCTQTKLNFIDFATMLYECTSIKIDPDDGLPYVLCQDCIDMLNKAYQFKQLCQKTDEVLQEYLKNPNIVIIKNELYSPHLQYISTELVESVTEIEELEVNPDETEILDETIVVDTIEPIFPIKTNSTYKRIYTCLEDNCNKTFNTISQYKKHEKVHSKIKESPKYGCDLCDAKFTDIKSYTLHKKVTHKIYQCKYCERSFRSPNGLSYHLSVFHKGLKPFKCIQCGKVFALKQALKKHLVLHTNIKDFLCTVCGKAYATYDSLQYHLRHHEGQRPYLCVHCGKTFKQSCHLKAHMWMHTGIKPHECKICGKCYTSGHQLKKHWKKYCGNNVTVKEENNVQITNDLIVVKLDSDDNMENNELTFTILS